MEKKPITIDYVRLKLGKKAEKMTDKEVENLLIMLRAICNKTIDAVIENYGETN